MGQYNPADSRLSGMARLKLVEATKDTGIDLKQTFDKVGIASTLKGNLIVGARAFHGNPYDGHMLH